MLKTDFFWTDSAQAEERLRNSYVLFGDCVAYVERISSSRSAGPRADIRLYPENRHELVSLSDPRFGRFRTPLPIGWVNNMQYRRAYFVVRSPQRSRIHGMVDSNTMVYQVRNNGLVPSDELRFSTLATDLMYKAAINNDYPPLDKVIDKIKQGTCIAFSKNMCINRDTDGIRWLFVGADRVGLFTGSDTLLLLSSFSYVKEQLAEAAEFTVNNIMEF